jgi:hypothetical protein
MNWHLKNIPLYPANAELAAQFVNPPAIYRGTPFWSWNAKLDGPILMRQIDALREMGMGGFHIHPRTGLTTPYLGEEFMGYVRQSALKAQRDNMIVWLYDEDRWPSGFAGGLVTKDHSLRGRHLLWTCKPYATGEVAHEGISTAVSGRQGHGILLGRYEVVLRDGCLASYRRLAEGQTATAGVTWYAYLEVAGNSAWFNHQAYVDTLNPKAIAKFIEITHETYARKVGDLFGTVIPAMFTDEPQFEHKQQLGRADSTDDVILPFTDELFDTFAAAYDQRLEDYLPELFWELPDRKPSLARYRYHDHVAERFATAFSDQCGKWCLDHGLALTGHMMEEPTLHSQTAALGEAMRSYRAFQLPGIDMLCDWREYTTAKQAQSAAHQYGRPGVLSELYGVTNWDFTFAGHKAQGDWQAALGVTVRVHHLAWVSMAGEAKRDYPAAIDYHSPWYKEYPLIEDHYARVNVALTRGQARVRIGVIHPVESYWLAFGPLEQTKLEREQREAEFRTLTEWLLFGLLDFDFICESTLPELCRRQQGDKFTVGQMAYDVVIVPPMRTLRRTTLTRLKAFTKAGGRVIFIGEIPELIDARPNPAAQRLAKRCTAVQFNQSRVLAALEAVRELSVKNRDGSPAAGLLHQFRQEGEERYLFVCNTRTPEVSDGLEFTLSGAWKLSLLDTLAGTIRPFPCTYENGRTRFQHDLEAQGSLLLHMVPGRAAVLAPVRAPRWQEHARLEDPVRVTLSEPNVLVLDQARWRLNEESWQPCEEVLRLDNLARQKLHLPLRQGHAAQPWVDTEPKPCVAKLSLAFAIQSDIEVCGAVVALECASHARILFDGQPVAMTPQGWWVDEAIVKIPLPKISAGAHELLIEYEYGRHCNVECSYLLGAFGVSVAGRHARITAPVKQLAWADWTHQGLPFYAGNVTYHATFEAPGGPLQLATPHMAGPLLKVELDGRLAGRIAFGARTLDLGELTAGPHTLDLCVFGNRAGAFGQLHNAAGSDYRWWGPDSWRTTGRLWQYEYRLWKMGLLSAPVLNVVR